MDIRVRTTHHVTSNTCIVINIYLIACSAGEIQCPVSGGCISNTLLCNDQTDCLGTNIDESAVICGEMQSVKLSS